MYSLQQLWRHGRWLMVLMLLLCACGGGAEATSEPTEEQPSEADTVQQEDDGAPSLHIFAVTTSESDVEGEHWTMLTLDYTQSGTINPQTDFVTWEVFDPDDPENPWKHQYETVSKTGNSWDFLHFEFPIRRQYRLILYRRHGNLDEQYSLEVLAATEWRTISLAGTKVTGP